MSDLRSQQTDSGGERWAMLAVARDASTAERWRDVLEEHSVDAEIRIEDAVMTGRSTATTYANSPGDPLFAYAVWVPADDREEAASVLIDAGWDGRYGEQSRGGGMSTGYVVRGTLIAIAIAVGLVVLRMATG
jgi:hypothetical protein